MWNMLGWEWWPTTYHAMKPVNSKIKSQDITRGLIIMKISMGTESYCNPLHETIRNKGDNDWRCTEPIPSISAKMLKTSIDLLPCIVNYSSGTWIIYNSGINGRIMKKKIHDRVEPEVSIVDLHIVKLQTWYSIM